MKRKSKLTIAIAAAVLAVFGVRAVYAQDKYSLKSPSGIAFSDFGGYEDWAVVSSARTNEVLKVIVANPTMIKAYKAAVPGNGQPFPDDSKTAKLQWKPKKSPEAAFVVDVPDIFTQAFVMEKDGKRFPKGGGWGYALFNYDATSDSSLRIPAPQTAETRAMWRSRRRTTSSIRTRSVELRPHGAGDGSIQENETSQFRQLGRDGSETQIPRLMTLGSGVAGDESR
jgi:hypothetical protein